MFSNLITCPPSSPPLAFAHSLQRFGMILISLINVIWGINFNFNFNLFILYHIHQYHEYILHTFTYIFIDRRRIQGPIWPIRSFSNGTFTFTHHIWIFLRLEPRASGILDLYDTIYKFWLKYAGYHTWTTRYKCIYMFIFIYNLQWFNIENAFIY